MRYRQAGRITPVLALLIVMIAGCQGAAAGIPTITPTTAAMVDVASTLPSPTDIPPSPSSEASSPTAVPTITTTAPATTPTAVASPMSAATATSAPTVTIASALRIGSELLFLRGGDLTAYDLDARRERVIARNVQEFAATPDGRMLAIVRSDGLSAEIWLVQRDGSDLRQATDNTRAESSLAWASDGLTLAYASASVAPARPFEWQSWAAWCAASDVRLLDIVTERETTLEAGCDPAFSPDGLRIAFATPPQAEASGFDAVNAVNTIRLVNRRGQNGWSFTSADPERSDESGLLVYAPSWSPDGLQLAYQRFVGYRALVDLDYIEMAGSFQGNGDLLGVGAGWLLDPLFAPSGNRMAAIEYDYSNARGFSGYDVWSVQILDLERSGAVFLPTGERETQAAEIDQLAHVAGAAWSPDGSAMAVLLPPNWSADVDANEALYETTDPGEIWRWVPGDAPAGRLVEDVDYASPLVWLPAPPLNVVGPLGYRLFYPAEWRLEIFAEFEEYVAMAPDGLRVISAAPIGIEAPSVTEAFPLLVGAVAEESNPIALPDGSRYQSFAGTTPDGTPIAGAMRTIAHDNDMTIAFLYRTTPQLWPLEQAVARALLAAERQR